MKQNNKLFATALAITGGLSLAGSANAQLIDAFNNTGLGSPYAGVWATTGVTITPTANGLDVLATGIPVSSYGSGYQGVAGGNVSATGPLLSLTFDVISQTGSTQGGYIGPTVDLIDNGSVDSLYNSWYASYAPGVHTVTATLTSGSAGGSLNTGDIQIFRVGLDSQSDTGYEILYQNVSIVSAPEPGVLALMGFGGCGLLMLARRRFARA